MRLKETQSFSVDLDFWKRMKEKAAKDFNLNAEESMSNTIVLTKILEKYADE